MGEAPSAGPVLRWLRALLLAGLALTLGVLAHVGADGLLPGPAHLAGMLAVSTAGAAPLLGRQASTTRLVVLVMAWQSCIHVALTASAGHGGTPAEHGGGLDSAPVWAPDWAEHLVADLTGPHALMAVAHLAAAAAMGWWLACGERALWTLLHLASRPVARAAAVVLWAAWWPNIVASLAKVSRARVAARTADRTAPTVSLILRVVTRRGPPLLSA